MIPVFDNPSDLERKAKENFSIPPFLMMENAASALAKLILELNADGTKSLHIFCGKGNNGADGLALARQVQNKMPVFVYCPIPPSTEEGSVQYTMACKLGIPIKKSFDDFFQCNPCDSIIADCIYGTGFHGSLPEDIKILFDNLNSLKDVIRIACDIPSGMSFKADYTVSMGELKLPFFTDKGKNVCGKIIKTELGISSEKFEGLSQPVAEVITKDDIILPYRKNQSANKGTYGHTLVFAGEKSGAAVLCASAAMNFGSGLTSLFKSKNSNLEQFKISPELMICQSIPEKTTAISIGSGLGNIDEDILLPFTEWFHKKKNPACVIDADLLTNKKLKNLLEELNKNKESRIILTPHLKELQILLENLEFDSEFTKCPLTEIDRIKAGKEFTKRFANCTIIMKSAVTYIASEGNIYICQDGSPSLAKGGSGDVLAGMCAALLAQGYSSKDAAITAVETHALASHIASKESYSLTPEKLIKNISML
ncbi:MAG: NAD(P)H-hydrate dehydratase [Treponema sp.]|nr:NAD(P)H-hydrate dehydratase [Treponema sp.]